MEALGLEMGAVCVESSQQLEAIQVRICQLTSSITCLLHMLQDCNTHALLWITCGGARKQAGGGTHRSLPRLTPVRHGLSCDARYNKECDVTMCVMYCRVTVGTHARHLPCGITHEAG